MDIKQTKKQALLFEMESVLSRVGAFSHPWLDDII